MKITKIISVLLSAAMLAVFFASCAQNGPGKETGSESSEPGTTSEQKVQTTAADTEEPGDKIMYEEPKAGVEKQDVVYKKVGGKELLMTIYQPTTKKYDKSPVYYLVTGGGWNTCDRAGMTGFSAASMKYLRQNGFAVTTIDYRIMGGGADDMADIISDCMDGVRYLIKFADVLKVDVTKIVPCGHSAGGHLALMTALGDQSLFVNDSPFGYEGFEYRTAACVSLSGLTVCYSVNGKILTAVSHLPRLFGNSKTNQATHDASPLDCIKADMCPILICTGTDDPAVYPENTYMFRDKAAEVGADVTTVISEHAGHSYEPMNGADSVSVTFTQVQKKITEFITEKVK